MTFERKHLGQEGEDEAEEELIRQGYEILQRNYKNKIGEIDIVAKDDGILCFVEVKTKSGHGYGTPEEMVGYRKQNKILKTAEFYLLENNLENIDWRVDVVAVDKESREIRLLKNVVVKGLS